MELSGLLEFEYVNRSIITVTTPCLSLVCARPRVRPRVRPRLRVRARVRVSSACARAHMRCFIA